MTEFNTNLGELKMSVGVHEKVGKARTARITVDLELDANGLLTVTARLGAKIVTMPIDYARVMASKERASEALRKAAEGREDTRKEVNRIKAKFRLLQEVNKMQYKLQKVRRICCIGKK